MPKISDIKHRFYEELSSFYPEEDLSIFFYILLEEFTGLQKIELISDYDLTPDGTVNDKLQEATDRLKQYEPIQYITGSAWFYDIKLKVTRDVLIPRPETEELVDYICKQQKTNNKQRILDIGTGSGCIAIALKKNLPEQEVYATDISEKALEIAKGNATLNNTDVRFFKMDIINYKSFDTGNKIYDLIVSNPPYVRESEKDLMQANVLNFEPYTALFVDDNDALKFYKAISDFALDGHLSQNGMLYFEINEKLGEAVTNLLKSKGFTNIVLRNDINDKPRMISCTL